MLVVMERHAGPDAVQRVVDVVREMGYEARPIPGRQRTAVGIIGNDGRLDPGRLTCLPQVLDVIHVSQPYKQVSREWREDPTVITLPNGVEIGGEDVVVMAGPCAVESAEQILATAEHVRAAGATLLRGGAFKPRSSPYTFQGLGERGLELLALARERTGLGIVTEALDTDTLPAVADVADIVQIGARNMQNYSLLRLAGRIRKPVLLKRGMAATIKDLLLSAEYVLSEGNPDVILCERGVRSFDSHTRNLFDVTAIPVVHTLSHLPIVADPSHGTGLRAKVRPMARAAVAAGADGLLIEVHVRPEEALSDGAQTLDPVEFAQLMHEVGPITRALGRRLAVLPSGPRADAGIRERLRAAHGG
jgi:3-deoxy-7-phosphoheptulonate synthase